MACGSCGSGSSSSRNGCCSGCGATSNRGRHRSLLKFYGELDAVGASFTTTLADGTTVLASQAIYPAAAPRTLKNLSVRLSALLSVGAITVQLYKNSTAVSGFLVTFPAGSTAGLVKSVNTSSVDLAQGDTFELRATGDASVTGFTAAISATVGVS